MVIRSLAFISEHIVNLCMLMVFFRKLIESAKKNKTHESVYDYLMIIAIGEKC